MVQRPLRLGDIVDDYCPRERRVTNHAIVAIVGESVRQTRCSTCDTEHEFKGARMPRKKGKSAAGEPAGVLVTSQAAPAETSPSGEVVAVARVVEVEVESAPMAAASEPDAGAQDEVGPEGWAAHRRLIRATLPRVEGGEPPPRPIPEFTMHQRQARGFQGRGGFRHGHGNGHPHSQFGNGSRGNHGGNPNQFRDGEGDGNRAQPPGGGAGKPGRRRRRRRR